MIWWLLAAGAVFYLLHSSTAPKAREVLRPGTGDGVVNVPRIPQAGTEPETLEGFAGGRATVYDPAKNPFRAKPSVAPVAPVPDKPPAAGGDSPGSYDDVADDMDVDIEAGKGEEEEVPGGEDITAEDADVDSNGQY